MSKPTHPAVESMSHKDMERTIFDILTDNGMDDDEADKTIDCMSVADMEQYLSEAQDCLDEYNEEDDA